jgi:hypothetical protein
MDCYSATKQVRMSGAVPPYPLYAFMSRTGTALPLIFALLLVSGNKPEERNSSLLRGGILKSHNFDFFKNKFIYRVN